MIAVFGDVHGMIEPLRLLIRELRRLHGPDLDLYSVGDLIDRGPHTKEVIELCIAEDVRAVSGNHERWFQDALRTGVFRGSEIRGCTATVASYGGLPQVPATHRDYILEAMPPYRQVGRVIISHAGLHNGRTDPAKALSELGELFFWVYLTTPPTRHDGIVQVFGHTVVGSAPHLGAGYCAVDTGCGVVPRGARLSAVVLDEDTGRLVDVISVPA